MHRSQMLVSGVAYLHVRTRPFNVREKCDRKEKGMCHGPRVGYPCPAAVKRHTSFRSLNSNLHITGHYENMFFSKRIEKMLFNILLARFIIFI